jgi:hypothetical protein
MRGFAVIALGLALTNAPAAGASPAPAKAARLLKNKLEAARTAFKTAWAGQWDDVEVLYRWSLRWLEVERELSDRTENRIAALQAHLERTRAIERVTRRRFGRRLITIDQVRAAAFYVAEAEVWLGQTAAEAGTGHPSVGAGQPHGPK